MPIRYFSDTSAFRKVSDDRDKKESKAKCVPLIPGSNKQTSGNIYYSGHNPLDEIGSRVFCHKLAADPLNIVAEFIL